MDTVQPVHTAHMQTTSGQTPKNPARETGEAGKEADKTAKNPQMTQDTLTLSGDSEPRSPHRAEEEDPELAAFLRTVERHNREMKAAAERLKPLKVEKKVVPSALGLSAASAASTLRRAQLKVCTIVQEYNERVPRGHVISQTPGPGGSTTTKTGVRLIVSKGPPPEKEKYDTIRKKEKVAYVDTKFISDRNNPAAANPFARQGEGTDSGTDGSADSAELGGDIIILG